MTIIKTFEPEETKRKLPKLYIILAIIGLSALMLIEIWVNNTMIAYGERFEKLTTAEKNLRMENQILENEIAKRSSYINIASESAELGFSSGQSILYIR
ncbi:hypothetical protein HYW43_03405 [Candidatus Daviesbacteria bacterium]|nr:hypothetical protein [Candidatus Daviesbacteria bacterium]